MDFQKWAAEYQQEADALSARITMLRQQRRTIGCRDINELDRRIAILYTMYLELRDVAKTLETHPQNRKDGAAKCKTDC